MPQTNVCVTDRDVCVTDRGVGVTDRDVCVTDRCMCVWQVFGDISVPGMDKDIKKALEQGSRDLPNVSASGAQRKVSLETPMGS